MHRERIHQIKKFSDFDAVSQEITQNLQFSEKKLMLHKMALSYLMHSGRLIDSFIADASANLFERMLLWIKTAITGQK